MEVFVIECLNCGSNNVDSEIISETPSHVAIIKCKCLDCNAEEEETL
jgi:hypothetical protein